MSAATALPKVRGRLTPDAPLAPLYFDVLHRYVFGLSVLHWINDALMALQTLKQAFTCDVSPILAMARHRSGGAIDPIATYRATGYREQKAIERPASARREAGIV